MSINSITNEGALSIAQALQVNTTLQKLNISDNKIYAGISAISDRLKLHPTLIEFSMLRNHITDKGAKVMGEVIKINRLLQTLRISFNIRVHG